MDRKQIKNVLTGDFSGIDDFIQNIIFPIFGEKCFDRKAVPEELVTKETKDAANNVNVSSILNIGTIGNISSEDIELFDVTLKNTSEISRSRVGIQQLIRSTLSQFSHAFILFHYKDCKNKEWRFSYLHKDDSLRNTTSAKRFTYVFGKEHNPKTASERFEILSQSLKTDDDLIKAFSVEALSEEFFRKYEEHYNRFVNYLIETPTMQKSFSKAISSSDVKGKEKDVPEIYKAKYKPLRDYVKKMMGRLVFLYFLERKGWLAGNKFYMSQLFSNSNEKKDFLDKVLEPLFFGVLNTPKSTRKTFFEQNGWDWRLVPNALEIPYLNGGLFEQDELDKCRSKFPQEYFSDLFNFFGEYNFTVDENEPNDEEMGIDPEMLSIIFESLLEDNKGKGAFYTPKAIVQSMCRESLIAYLVEKSKISETAIRFLVENTDSPSFPEEIEKNKASIIQYLVNVKICDPAIGSGAFPMGMLNLLVRVRLALCPLKNRYSNEIIELKKNIIKNNIYGVDIEKGAIDIARLRFWLSIVVDSKADYENVEPLPNFDYKFMRGNSLYPTFEDKYVDLSIYNTKSVKGTNLTVGALVQKNLNTLTELRKEFFNLFGKDKYKKEIEIKDLTLYTLKTIFEAEYNAVNDNGQVNVDLFGVTTSKKKKELELNKKKKDEIKKIMTQVQFVREQLNNRERSLEERAKTDIRFFEWNMCFGDIGEKAVFDIVIGNPPYIASKVLPKDDKTIYKELYSFALKQFDLYSLFIEKSISLTKESGIISLIIPDSLIGRSNFRIPRMYLLKKTDILKWIHISKVFDNANVASLIFTCVKNDEGTNHFTYEYSESVELWKQKNVKTQKINTSLVSKAVDNKVFFADEKEYKFINRLFASENFDANFFMWRGEEIGKKTEGFSKVKEPGYIPLLVGENVKRYKTPIIDRFFVEDKVKKDKNLYKREKILVRQLGSCINATIDSCGAVTSQAVYNLIPNEGGEQDVLYAVGLLNSSLFDYLYNAISGDKQLFQRIVLENIKALPFPNCTKDIKEKIAIYVKRILGEQDLRKIKEYEKSINDLVFKIFDLSYEEETLVRDNYENNQNRIVDVKDADDAEEYDASEDDD